jgi:hypothetical protein
MPVSNVAPVPAEGAYKSEKDKAAEEAVANQSKKKGLFFQLLDESDRVKEESEMKKRERINEIYGQRMREKAMEKERADRAKQREYDQ